MAIQTGTMIVDETSGLQSGGTGDNDGNDFAVGLAGVTLPAPLNSIIADALSEGGTIQVFNPTTTTIALSGSTASDPDGAEILDFTGLGTTPIVDVRFTLAGGVVLNGTVTAKFLDPTDGNTEKDLLTVDGFKIYLWPSDISNDAVIGRKATAGGAPNADGDIVFIAYLDTNTISGDPATEQLDAGATGAKVWLVEFEPLQHPDSTDPDDAVSISNLFVTVDQFSSFSLEGAPSGQNLFLTFGDGTPGLDDNGDPADEVSIVVTATNAVNQSAGVSITTGGTVNTGQGGGGTTLGHTNQMVDPGEALAFTFVTGSNRDYTVALDHSLDLDQNGNADYLDQNEADVENNIQFTGLHTTTGASFTIVQLQQDKAATLTISASNADFAPAGAYIDELLLFDDGFVNINYVKVSLQKKVGNQVVPVLDQNGDQVFTEFGPGDSGVPDSVTGITVFFNTDGTVTLTGVEALDVIEYHTGDTNGDLTHSRVVIANSAVNPGNQSHIDAAFDIGQFALRSSVSVTEPFTALVFEDDGPTADLTDFGGAVTIDETADNQNDDTADGADTTAVAALFAGVAAPTGTDLSPTEYAISTTALVDDDSLFGNDGPAASDSVVLSLQIGGIDGVDDGNGTNSGLTTTDGTAIFLYYEGDLIVGRYDADADGTTGDDGNEEAAFAIALQQDGNVAVAQYVSLTHGTPGDGTTPAGSYDERVDLTGKVNAVVTVTDLDGDSDTDFVPIGDDINFEDDGPDADIVDGTGSTTIDETAGIDASDDDVDGTTATLGGVVLTTVFVGVANKGSDGADLPQYALSDASLVNTSGSSFGQDEEGGTKVLSLVVTNAVSGLQTTDGLNIKLFKEGNLIVGRYDSANGDVSAADPAAFAIALAQDGNVATVQYVSLKHPTFPSNYDESVDLTGKVGVKVLVTDGDGDTSEATVDIGDQLLFEDDGPDADIVDGAGSVTIDETAGIDASDDDVTGATQLGGVALTTVFNTTNVPNPGSDGAAFPQYAKSDAPLANSAGSSFGQDEEGATKVLSLVVTGGTGSSSDLFTTAGDEIFLFEENGLIVGRYDSDGDLDVDADDDAAFAIALGQDGHVATVQYVSLTHGSPGDGSGGTYDEQVDLDGKVDVKVVVTDGDGDKDEATVAIGNDINFEDDGPTADVADGAGSVTIDETAGIDLDDDDVAGATTLGGVALTTVFGGVANKGSDGADLPQYALSDAPLANSSGSSFGQDDEGGTKVLSLAVTNGNGTTSDLSTTAGDEIFLFLENGLIVGRYDSDGDLDVDADDDAAFAIALGQDGKVATVQYVSLTHNSAGNGTVPAGSYDEQIDLSGKVDVKVLVTDGDGDTSEDTVAIGNDINFEDDGPTADIVDGTGSVTIDETAGIDADDDDVAGATTLGGVALTTVFSGVATKGSDGADLPQYALSDAPLANSSGSSFGQDDEGGTKVLSLVVTNGNGTTSGLYTTDGKEIYLFLESGLIVGRYETNGVAGITTADAAAFAIALGQDGKVATVQYVSLKHNSAGNGTVPAGSYDEQIDLTGKVDVKVVVTDGDGDTSEDTVAIGNDINFEDDGPALSGVLDSTNSLLYAAGTIEAKAFTYSAGADNEEPQGVALTGFIDPNDPADAAAFAASGLDDLEALLGINISATQVGNTVTYYTPDGGDAGSDPDPLFSLTVTDTGWTFNIYQDPALVFNSFDFGAIAAGGPVEIAALQAGSGNTWGVFNGLLFGEVDSPDGSESRGIFPPAAIDLPGTTGTNTDDDINPNDVGFGIRGEAASNMNNNEGFSLSFHQGSAGGALTSVEGMRIAMDQQGNTDDVVISFVLANGTPLVGGNDPDIVAIEEGASINLIDDKGVSGTDNGDFWIRLGLPSGNNDIFFTILSEEWKDSYTPLANEIVIYTDGVYDTAYFRMAYPKTGTYDVYGNQDKDPDTNPEQVGDSLRINDVSLIEVAPIPDLTLTFEVQGTDGDGDTTQTESFNVYISEDGSPF